MTTDVDCADLQGVFLLYSTSGDMIGLGLAPWGSFTSGANATWFEDITSLETEVCEVHFDLCTLNMQS